MRRLLTTCLLLVLVFAASVLADYSVRIVELKQRQNAILLDIGARQDIIAVQNQQIQALQVEYTKLQGAIEELEYQDVETAKAAKEKEKK